jgi:alkanesulfonate monooxygenase SsuD/methylene tetrahydromethanopterin reductase-like flavin-dependent oxidoreductase (luciferase family)
MLHLTASLAGSGHHPAAWRIARQLVRPDGAAIQRLAHLAERGKLDAVWLAPTGPLPLDPLPVLGSLIGVTRQLGLGAAWTVDHTEPFHVARVFASLDHLSYGRTAWLVGLFEAETLAPRIGRPPPTNDIAAYCRRAGEFVDVVKKLWDSWEDAALVLDKASGTFVDPDHIHPIHHAGGSFTVRGPLNVPRPPQGNPLIVMHDPADDIARRFVAETADVILTSSETLSQARQRYRELHALAAPRPIRILANIGVLLAETAAEQRAAALDGLHPPPAGLRFVGTPEQLIELFSVWHEERACDGFNLLPERVDDFDLLVDRAIPLGQKADLFRVDYAGATLREYFGLTRPLSQYSGAAP